MKSDIWLVVVHAGNGAASTGSPSLDINSLAVFGVARSNARRPEPIVLICCKLFDS